MLHGGHSWGGRDQRGGGVKTCRKQGGAEIWRFGRTVDGPALLLALRSRGLLGDPAFEAGAAEHAVGPSAVQGASAQMVQAGADAPQPAELLPTIRSNGFGHLKAGFFQNLFGLHLMFREKHIL